MSFWQDRRVLVTGATGFVGSALAQRLAAAGARVTGVGRNLAAVAYLEEAGVTLRRADLRDQAAMRAAVAGQEVVFHAAAWLSGRHGKESEAHALNVTAVQELVRAAGDAGISRFIQISSVAAYGPPRDGDVLESCAVATQQRDVYGRSKAIGENEAHRLAQTLGLPLVIARPGMIYGPRAYGWTINMLTLVQKRTPVILGRGDGYACPIYIDNFLDGLLLAGSHAAAAGQAFNFCDAPIPWRQFFDYYGAMCGKRPVRLPLGAAQAMIKLLYPLGLSPGGITPDLLHFYTAKARYPTTQAERLLGYQARVGIDEGMRRAESWLRAQGYLPRAGNNLG